MISIKGGFGSALMMKDLGLSQDAANRTGTATPLGALSLQVIIQEYKKNSTVECRYPDWSGFQAIALCPDFGTIMVSVF